MSKTRFVRLVEKLRGHRDVAKSHLPEIINATVDITLELHNQIKIQKEFICQLEKRVDQLEHTTSGHQGFLG